MKLFKSLLLLFFIASSLFSQKYLIRFATVAPEGSTWLNIMKEYDAAIRKESGGQMGFKIYGGGVAGDEKDVIRKIRLNQYHAAGFTGVGMGEITPKVRILDAPFLFKKDYAEVDYIYNKYNQEMFDAFWQNDFVLLGWAEVGFVYVFTNIPINAPGDMKSTKMWVWQGDPVAESAFKAIGISPIPLAFTDVFTSLQTGLINGYYTVPLAGISLQWFTKAKYILDVPLANSAGSVLISKKYWDTMPEDLRNILLNNGRKYMRKLTELSRQDNDKSLKILQNKGLKLIKANDKSLEEYQRIGLNARLSLAGTLFPKDLLDRFEVSLKEYRKGKK
jgi:TRAP-type transport system periplasmic protein